KDGLANLLARLAEIDELRWIRFLYAYPNKITGRLLDTVAAHDKICSYVDVTLRTSFIVGFPGETEAEFQELRDFVGAAEFDWMGVFGYSDEDGAGAFRLDDKVPAREIERRRKKLMRMQQ